MSYEIKAYYSIKEFAEMLNVHPHTIRNGIKYGRIQAFRIGKGKTASFRIPHTEIQRMALFDLKKVVKDLAREMEDGRES